MIQKDKDEIEKMINSKLNIIERITKLEVQVDNTGKFNRNVTISIIVMVIGWIILEIFPEIVEKIKDLPLG